MLCICSPMLPTASMSWDSVGSPDSETAGVEALEPLRADIGDRGSALGVTEYRADCR